MADIQVEIEGKVVVNQAQAQAEVEKTVKKIKPKVAIDMGLDSASVAKTEKQAKETADKVKRIMDNSAKSGRTTSNPSLLTSQAELSKQKQQLMSQFNLDEATASKTTRYMQEQQITNVKKLAVVYKELGETKKQVAQMSMTGTDNMGREVVSTVNYDKDTGEYLGNVTKVVTDLKQEETALKQAAAEADKITKSVQTLETKLSSVNSKAFNQTSPLTGNFLSSAGANGSSVAEYKKALEDRVAAMKAVVASGSQNYGTNADGTTRTWQQEAEAIKTDIAAYQQLIAEKKAEQAVSQQQQKTAEQAQKQIDANISKQQSQVQNVYNKAYSGKSSLTGDRASTFNAQLSKLTTSAGAYKTDSSEANLQAYQTELQNTINMLNQLKEAQNAEQAAAAKSAKQAAASQKQVTTAQNNLPQQIEQAKAMISKLQSAKTDATNAAAQNIGASLNEVTTAASSLNSGNLDAYKTKVQALKEAMVQGQAAMRQYNESARSSAAFDKISSGCESATAEIEKLNKEWTKMSSSDRTRLSGIQDMFDSAKISGSAEQYKNATDQLKKFKTEMQLTGKSGMTFSDKLTNSMGNLAAMFSTYRILSAGKQAIDSMISSVTELDTAMTNLKKVSDESQESYDAFFNNLGREAQDMSANMVDYINAVTGFSRIGYDLDQAEELGRWATIYKNVGDEVDSVDDATSSLISTMKAFKMEASDAQKIVDAFNYVGNNYPITSGGVGEILQRSAASMAAANTSMEKTIALGTAANSVVQNTEKVGTSLSTMSMRLRGSTAELEDAGEEIDDYCESTSKLQKTVKSLSGVDIMSSATEYKDVYDILQEISQVYDKLTDVNKASLLEALFGKRQANIGAAILSNFDIAESVVSDLSSDESNGSAMKEYETYEDSVVAKQNKMTAAFQEFSASFLGSSIIGGTYDVGTGILGFLTQVTNVLQGMPTLIASALTALGQLTGIQFFSKDGTGMIQNVIRAFTQPASGKTTIDTDYKQAQTWLEKNSTNDVFNENADFSQLPETFRSVQMNATSASGAIEAVKNKLVEADTTSGRLKATFGGIGKTIKALGASIGSMLANFAINYLVSMAVSAIANLYDQWVNAEKYAKEAFDNISASWDKMNESQQSAKKTVEEYGDSYEKLQKGVDAAGNNVSLSESEYEEYKTAVSAISSVFPELISGHDELGNAIKLNITSVQQLEAEYEKLAQQNRTSRLYPTDTATQEEQTKAFGYAKEQVSGDSNEQLSAYKDALTALNSGDQAKIDAYLSDLSIYKVRAKQSAFVYDESLENMADLLGPYAGNFDRTPFTNPSLSAGSKELAQAISAVTSAYTTVQNTQSAAVNEQYAQMFQDLYFSAVSSENPSNANGVPITDTSVQQILQNYITSRGVDFYSQFDGADRGTVMGQMQTWINGLIKSFTSGSVQNATSNLSSAATDYKNDVITVDELASERQNFVETAQKNGLDAVVAGQLRDSISGSWDSIAAQIEHAKSLIKDETQSGVDDWAKNLTSGMLEFFQQDGLESMNFDEFNEAYAYYKRQLQISLSAVTKEWTNTLADQTTANEVMSAQDQANGSLTLDNYKKLIAANPDYAMALDTSSGSVAINAQKLQQIMTDENNALIALNQEGMKYSIDKLEAAKDVLKEYTDEQNINIDSQKAVVEGLKQEVLQRALLTQEIQFNNSEYGKWISGQDTSESGDQFRNLNTALTNAQTGLESGRTNTNKYQTAMDVLFGSGNWDKWSNATTKKKLEKASSLYTSEGELDNAAMWKQMAGSGVATKQDDGSYKINDNLTIEDMAAKMGYGIQNMAMILQAAKEYGSNQINIPDDQINALLPVSETDANTSALQSSTTATQGLITAVQSDTTATQALAAAIDANNTDSGTEGRGETTTPKGTSTESATGQVATADLNAGITVPMDVDTTVAMAKGEELQAELSKSVTKTVNVVTVFGGTTTGNSSSVGGPSAANGTTSAKGGTSLVAELGSEIIVDRRTGSWRLATEPQLTHLNKGDIVFDAEKTKKILSGSANVAGGKSFDTGTPSLYNNITRILFGTLGGTPFVTGSGKPENDSQRRRRGGGGGNSGSNSPSLSDILDKFGDLYDWIEKALDVAEKGTQKLIDKAAEMIGYVSQNRVLDQAIAATAKELETNQSAYNKYMGTANSVQKETGLSSEIVKLIQNGAIQISSYDDDTKKKIEEYQKWYDKAQACLDTIEDLKDQEKELSLNKLDNIIDNYDNITSKYQSAYDYSQAVIENMQSSGKEVVASNYQDGITAIEKQADAMVAERQKLTQQFNVLVAKGTIKEGDSNWYKYKEEIDKLDQSIIKADTDVQGLKQDIQNIALTRLQNALAELSAAQSALQGLISLHEAQGTDSTEKEYQDMIANGMKQIDNYEAQNDELERQQQGLDKASDRWRELQDSIDGNNQSIMDMKSNQEQWNDTIADLKIDALEKQREELEKENDVYQRQLDLQQAIEDLEKAKNQRKLVFRNGSGFVYEADEESIRNAQNRVDDLRHQEVINGIDDAIDAIEDNKENDNIYDSQGNLLVSVAGTQAYASGGVNTKAGLYQMDGTSQSAEVVFNASDASKLYDLVHNTADLSSFITDSLINSGASNLIPGVGLVDNSRIVLSIGDIVLEGVQNADDLSKQIISKLPNALLQKMNANH